MRQRDIALIGIWTLGTAGLLAIVQPQPLGARSADSAKVQIEQRLTIDGCDLRFRCEPAASPGASPILLVSADNRLTEAAHPHWAVSLMVVPQVSPMSRVGPIPEESWQQDGDVELDPGETSSMHLDPAKPIAKGATAYYVIRTGKQAVTVMPLAAAGKELAWAGASPGKRP